jgi:hypothetical protein
MSMDASRVLKTLGNQRRLEILAWLADPVANFPPQRDDDVLCRRRPDGRLTTAGCTYRGLVTFSTATTPGAAASTTTPGGTARPSAQ